MRDVTLTPADVQYAAGLAAIRCHWSMDRNGRPRGVRRRGADMSVMHLNGALGEVAVARGLGLPLPCTVATFHSDVPDLPPNIEVRWTSHDDGDLVVRPDDMRGAARRWVLVTGRTPHYVLRGWRLITSADDMDPRWWRDVGGYKEPAWWIPQAELVTDWP